MSGEAGTADKPKKHSPFAQVVFRKTGEAFDLGGKALVGLAGLGSAVGAHRLQDVGWLRLLGGFAIGGVLIAVGIYLQARAEET